MALALAVLVAPFSARAVDGACAEAATRAVQRRYESVKDLEARFHQTTQVASLGTGGGSAAVESRGTVVFAKPGRMRWAYSEPEESLVVSDGVVVWIYDPAAREVQRFAAGAGFMSGVAVQFLVGEGQLLRDFRVKASGCEEADVLLELTPREPAAYEKLVLVAHRASGEVRETRVHDLVGNVTRVVFDEMRTNLAPDPKVFVFEVPKGVRVVELTEPQPR